ncbi:N-acetyltransferase [Moraxella nasovis]|uniref:GNAT family N-acetyltransferase n=1 Tax=Moraxella nasovis TaxID=2904121 RepID=UPI001F6261F4|nr:GNAT family N-acetyltransferase [Moraxella nasovis]UNU72933.1 N-acetyltransferase [Moraxella nasovis]
MIHHNTDTHRFETTIDGHTAYLSYVKLNDDTLEYDHTIVPKELGGQGLGTRLVKFALDYAKEHHKKVVPSCSFVASFINKNPEYQSLLA